MIQRLAEGFVYSNLFVALVLALLTASSYFIVPWLAFEWHVPVSVFFGSHMLYSFHRLYKIDFIPIDQLQNRHRWILSRANWVRYGMMTSMLCGLVLLPNFQADTIIWLIPAGLVSIGYTIPILPADEGWRRFRDIPYTKPIIIAFTVAYFTLAFPVFAQLGMEGVFEGAFLRSFSERVLFLLAVTIPFEMRDLQNDKESGLETLATQYGFQTAKRTGYLAVAAWGVLVLWRTFDAGFSLSYILVSVGLLFLLLAGYRFLNKLKGDLFYVYVFEGLILVYAVLWSFLGTVQ